MPRPEILSGYTSLLDGVILHSIWLQIDPEPQYHLTKFENVENVANARAKNFDCIIKNIKNLFEDELGQTLIVVPDCSILGSTPGMRK